MARQRVRGNRWFCSGYAATDAAPAAGAWPLRVRALGEEVADAGCSAGCGVFAEVLQAVDFGIAAGPLAAEPGELALGVVAVSLLGSGDGLGERAQIGRAHV